MSITRCQMLNPQDGIQSLIGFSMDPPHELSWNPSRQTCMIGKSMLIAWTWSHYYTPPFWLSLKFWHSRNIMLLTVKKKLQKKKITLAGLSWLFRFFLETIYDHQPSMQYISTAINRQPTTLSFLDRVKKKLMLINTLKWESYGKYARCQILTTRSGRSPHSFCPAVVQVDLAGSASVAFQYCPVSQPGSRN